MAPKRSQGDDSPTSPQKSLKLEHSPENHSQDFSNSVKKKLSSSSRTGQACDRCKIRKIRCDGRPGGCSPCAQNNTPCKTTDRITGRATTRGHTEHLEAENDYLKRIIADLQTQLRDSGADVKPLQPFPTYVEPSAQAQSDLWAQPERTTNIGSQSATFAPHVYPYDDLSPETNNTSQFEGTTSGGLPTFKTGCYGDNYLGISSADSVLSPIKGTSLSIFGVELNLADFVPQDEDDETSPTSYQTFLRVALGRGNVEKLNFPEEKELRQFMTWYFRSLHPYSPTFHQPAVMDIVWKIYNDGSFQPSPAQVVIIHMILAMIKYQISTRNAQPDLLEDAHKHYLFAISHFPDLLLGHGLEDVQALALLSIHIRNFPKPGAAWLVTKVALTVAIELGLHRSSKSWAESAHVSQEEIELRKRVFWALFALSVGLSGRLGRPMPIRLEDMDVEYALPLNDTDEGHGQLVEKFSDCSFQIGLVTPGIAIVMNKMYSTIYSIRQSPQTYERTVRTLETEIGNWRAGLPKEFSAEVDSGENYIFARYTLCWEQEVKLLLHHPAVCTSTNPDFVEYNMSACLQAARDLIHVVDELRHFKSLDIPWLNVTVYLAAIFTTLYIYTQHKQTITHQELTDLQADMDLWMQVLEAIGEIYGTSDRLPSAVQKIIDPSMEAIRHRVAQSTATAAADRTASINHRSPSDRTHEVAYQDHYGSTHPVVHDTVDVKPSQQYLGNSSPHHSGHYQPAQYSHQPPQDYHSPAHSGPVAFPATAAAERNGLTDDEHVLQALQASTQAQAQAAHSHGTYSINAPVMTQQPNSDRANHFTAAWQEWTRQNVVNNLNGHGQHHIHAPGSGYDTSPTSAPQHPNLTSANALMALGSHRRSSTIHGHSPVPMHSGPPISMHGGVPAMDPQTQWPAMLFYQQPYSPHRDSPGQ